MAEQHPAEDVLLDLALGDVPEPDSEHLADHLSSCAECRSRYDAVGGTIDHTLAAAPRVPPPPGFDHAVLTSIGLAPPSRTSIGLAPPSRTSISAPHSRPSPFGRPRAQRRPPILVAAAAGLVGVALGVAGAVAANVFDDDPPADASVLAGAPLMTSTGETVGSAALSYLDGQQVLVVSAAGSQPGATYECRVRLADGTVETVGVWEAPEDGATWVVPAPATPAVGVELVNEAGAVWSSADI